MRFLRLYEERPTSAVERAEPLDLDRSCTRCPLSSRAAPKTVCLSADGTAGGLLVVGEAPGKQEDVEGRPFVGPSGVRLRQLVNRWWKGPVVFDTATRCFPGRISGPPLPENVGACRGYLAQTLAEARPTRVVTLGNVAALSVLGRNPKVLSTRKGVGWLGSGVPVFLVMHPTPALRNKFINRWFEEDLEWALTTEPTPPPWDGAAQVVETEEDALDAERACRAASWVAWDVEAAGNLFDPGFVVLCVTLAPAGSEDPYVFPLAATRGAPGAVLARILGDATIKKVGQNEKFDQLAIKHARGIEVRGTVGDTMLWRRILEPEALAGLAVSAELVGMGGHKEEAEAALAPAKTLVRKIRKDPQRAEDWRRDSSWSQIGNGDDSPEGIDGALAEQIAAANKKDLEGEGAKRFAFALLPRRTLWRYNARDSLATTLLAGHFLDQLGENPWAARVWKEIGSGLNHAVLRMEGWGIGADRPAIRQLSSFLALRQEEMLARFRVYGEDFNPKSNPQVAQLLYGKLGLRHTVRGKLPACVDEEVLDTLLGKHPVVQQVLDWRHVTTMRDRYADGLARFIRSDGRFHPNFKIGGTRTGRMACEDPNLHNIPRTKGSAEGKMIKDAFVAAPGHVFLEADFSQIELRIAAMLSGDPEMIRIFQDGLDYHQRTAELAARFAWGIDPSQVTEEHRSQAKTFNFGILYGQGDAALAAGAGCSKAQAAKLREGIMGRLKVLDRFIKACVRETRQSGVAWTWWDGERARCRPLPAIATENAPGYSKALNGAFNTPVQGTASDYCLRSLVEIVRLIEEEHLPARLVLSVHDSIMLELRNEDLVRVAGPVREAMTRWPMKHGVPLAVDTKAGPSWGSLEKFT